MRTKLIGLTLLASFALGASAAATASAEEGFLLPGGGTPTLANLLGGRLALSPEGGTSFECAKLHETHFEFENDKHGKVTLWWEGCKAAGLFSWNSLGDGSGQILLPVLFLVCLDPKNKEGKLLAAFGVSVEVMGSAHLEVPSLGTLVLVAGTALGIVSTTGEAELWKVELLGEKGKQTAVECSEGKLVKKHTLTMETNENGTKTPTSENIEAGLLQFDQGPVILMEK